MVEYSSPSGIGPRGGGTGAAARFESAFSEFHEADADTGGDEEASSGVSLEHTVLPFGAPGIAKYGQTQNAGEGDRPQRTPTE